MADQNRDIKYLIKVIADTKGAKDSAAALKDVQRAADQLGSAQAQVSNAARPLADSQERIARASTRAAGSMQQLRQAGGPATQILQGLERAGRGGIDALFGVATAIRGVITAVLTSTGPIGIVIAAVGLLAGAFLALKDKILPAQKALGDTGTSAETTKKKIDEAKAAIEEAGKTASGQAAEDIRELAEAYDTLRERADGALQAERAIARAEQGRDDAELEQTLAQIDQAEQAGKLTATQAAGLRAGARGEADQRRFAREQKLLDREIYREEFDIGTARRERDELATDVSRNERARSRAVSSRDQIADQIRSYFGRSTPSFTLSPKEKDKPGETIDLQNLTPESVQKLAADIPFFEKLATEFQKTSEEIEGLSRRGEELRKSFDETSQATDELVRRGEERIGALRRERQLQQETFELRRGTADARDAIAARQAAAEDAKARVDADRARIDAVVAREMETRRKNDERIAAVESVDPYTAAGMREAEDQRRAVFDRQRDAAIQRNEGMAKELQAAIAEGARQGVAEGLSDIPRRATGGGMKEGETAVVGEKGAELFTAPADGTVLPNAAQIDGIIDGNAEATGGDRAPTKPTRPRVISSNAEALTEAALESAAWAAQNGSPETGYGFDGSDRANAATVRDFAAREPERMNAMLREAFSRLESSFGANQAATLQAMQRLEHYMREIYYQGKHTRSA